MNQPEEAQNTVTVLYRCGCLYRQWQENGPAETKRLNHRCERHHVEPAWLTQDAGLPRDGRGNVVWGMTANVSREEKQQERDLPVWAQQRFYWLRQEVWTCQRALQRRNQRLAEVKHLMRTYGRIIIKALGGVLPKAESPTGQAEAFAEESALGGLARDYVPAGKENGGT